MVLFSRLSGAAMNHGSHWRDFARRATRWASFVAALMIVFAATRASADPIDLYVGSYSFGEVFTYTASGAESLFLPEGPIPGFSVAAMAFGPNGNLFVSADGTSSVYEVSATGNVTFFASTGFLTQDAIAFDSAGNLYVSNAFNPDGSFGNVIDKITPNGSVSTFATGLDGPFALAFNSADDLFVADVGTNTIDEITPSGVMSVFASGLCEPAGLAFNSAGVLFVANGECNTIDEISTTGVVSQFADNTVSVPDALAFDGAGNLYVTGGLNDPIDVYTPSGVGSLFAPVPDAAPFFENPQPDALAFGPAPIPEPGSLALLSGFLLATTLLGRRVAKTALHATRSAA